MTLRDETTSHALAIAELLTSFDADYVAAQSLYVNGGNWMS